MFRVFSCLTGEHDWRLVLLAVLVCLVASIVAFNIFHRAIASQARTRLIWIAIAGAAIGYGVWATHFIAMLAYEPGVSTGYGTHPDGAVTRFGDAADFQRFWLRGQTILVVGALLLAGAIIGALALPACTILACGHSKCLAA